MAVDASRTRRTHTQENVARRGDGQVLRGTRLPILAALLIALTSRAAAAHPLHTSLTAVTYDQSARVLQLSVRVFATDFLAAAHATSPDVPAVAAYLAARVVVMAPSGHRIVLAACGERRVGELLWLCLRAPLDALNAGTLLIRVDLLCERFEDQINVVQTDVAGRHRSLLFTRGDGAQPLSS